jgi:hypothetical protein
VPVFVFQHSWDSSFVVELIQPLGHKAAALCPLGRIHYNRSPIEHGCRYPQPVYPSRPASPAVYPKGRPSRDDPTPFSARHVQPERCKQLTTSVTERTPVSRFRQPSHETRL